MSVKEIASTGDIVDALRTAGRKVYALRVLEMAAEIAGLRATLARAGLSEFCEDEGCDHHGTEHICVSRPLPDRRK